MCHCLKTDKSTPTVADFAKLFLHWTEIPLVFHDKPMKGRKDSMESDILTIREIAEYLIIKAKTACRVVFGEIFIHV